MTRYVGFATGDAFVITGEPYSIHPLDGGPRFAWGAKSDRDPNSAKLAKAILCDTLGDIARATKLHRLFLHRCIVHLPKGESWSLSTNEVLNHVEQIEDAAAEMAGTRTASARELPQVLDGRLTREQKWTNNPDLVRNDPDKAKRPER